MRGSGCIILLALALAGCGGRSDRGSQADTHAFTDDYGRTVTVSEEPQRIVSTSPAVTEIVFALGAGDRLVGRTDYCTYPAEASAVESIGGISNLNIEKVISLSPDVVISGSMIPKKSTLQMEKMGVPTACVIEQPTFDGLYDNIRKIGFLIGRTASADSLVAVLQQQAQPLSAADSGDRPSVYYVVGFGGAGNYTAGGSSFINDIISLGGGRNIAADVQGWSYSLEALLDADPDYIVIRREDSALFCRTQPYHQLSAVREGRVIGLESGCIDLQVPRNIEAVKELRGRLVKPR